MTDPVLSQLVSVESDLAEQVEQLETQLTQLQAQRQGLHTVIDMFQAGDGTMDVDAIKTQIDTTMTKSAKKTATKAAAGKRTAASKKAATKSTAETKRKGKPGPKPKAKAGGRKKKDGRAANWQKHVKPEFKDSALPEAVSSVLRSQPSDVFKIADVMSSIFKEDVPRTSYLKARNRISKILSAGARDGTWYRGRNGRYSQSESVTKLK
ncbi:MAG: hypothetical protein AAFY72_14500 [Cyanobacteria bacterium J06649_4]